MALDTQSSGAWIGKLRPPKANKPLFVIETYIFI